MTATNVIVSRSGNAVAQFTAPEIKAQVQLIQEVMRQVMIEGVHFGTIPGTPKPSLFKPGAEVLCSVFRIAPLIRIEDLSTADSRRYRVTCMGQHQGTKTELGEGVGECSSDEAKYKWRSPVCPEEFDETPENLRRVKWTKGAGGKPYKQQQLRTEPADNANTVLKMASKRALVAMVLNVTAASDIFSQDLEDLPHGVDGDDDTTGRGARRGRAAPRAPQSTASDGPRMANDQQRKLIHVRLDQAGMSAETLCTHLGIGSLRDLRFEQVNEALTYIADPQRDEAAAQ